MTDSSTLPRKLAAILHADVVGYSRLTGSDEEGTYRKVRESLDSITHLVGAHNGRVVNYAGDAVLADFSSALDAVNCAVAIQKSLNQAETGIQFRIGINLGDVIYDRENIFGDGVNIAARLEALAEPGGICISESIRGAVGTKLPYSYRFMGEQPVKNINQPVRAYHLDLANADLPVGNNRQKRYVIAGIVVVLALALATYFLWPQWQGSNRTGAVQPAGQPASQPAEPVATDKPSIAVLPFNNLGGDKSQDYFADGMTEDLITDLSKISGMHVIARNSVFVYRNQAVNVPTVARELGVRYVLEGSVRKAGNQIRVNAQLIDGISGGHLWAERYDGVLDDIFAVQDRITNQIVQSLALKLSAREQEGISKRYTTNVEAYDLFLQGQARLFEFSEESYEQARELFRQAISLDPSFARAYSSLAVTYVNEVLVGYSNNPQASLSLATELTDTAISIDDTLPQVYFSRAYAMLFQRRHLEALEVIDKAILLDPNYADAHGLKAFIHVHRKGGAKDAFEPINLAIKLNPNYNTEYLGILAQAHFWTGNYERALEYLEEALQRNVNYLPWHIYSCAVYIRLGRLDDAEWSAVQIQSLHPEFELQKWASERPIEDIAQLDSVLNDLRKAGLE